MTTIAWVLNLDADLELADPDNYRPSTRQLQQSMEQGNRFLDSARAHTSADVLHVPLAQAQRRDVIHQAWCPTRLALDAAARCGARLRGPGIDVLRRVNHRAFGARLSEAGTADGRSRFVTTAATVQRMIAADPSPSGWLLKRPHGFSGRGRKHVIGSPSPADQRWIEASMVSYGCGLHVERFVDIEAEFALHGFLGEHGDLLVGCPTRLICDASGAFVDSQPARDEITAEEEAELRHAFRRCHNALAAAGYFGAFSIDAFRWLDVDGRRRFRPLSELNARYSMGFFVGLAEREREWIERLQALHS